MLLEPTPALLLEIDDQCRLKVPPLVQLRDAFEWAFATTLNLRSIRVYSRSAWTEAKRVLEDESDRPADAEDLLFVAIAYGKSTSMDADGNIQLPENACATLGLIATRVVVLLRHNRKGEFDLLEVLTPKAWDEIWRCRVQEATRQTAQRDGGVNPNAGRDA